MRSRAARHNHDLLNLPDLLIGHPQFFYHDLILLDPGRECIHDRFRLLIHFLKHEMLISAFLSRIHIPLNPYRFFLNRLFVHIEELHRVLR